MISPAKRTTVGMEPLNAGPSDGPPPGHGRTTPLPSGSPQLRTEGRLSELPLSGDDQGLRGGGGLGNAFGMGPTAQGARGAAPAEENGPPGNQAEAPAEVAERSLFSRPGRKDHAMLEALANAQRMVRAAEAAAATQASAARAAAGAALPIVPAQLPQVPSAKSTAVSPQALAALGPKIVAGFALERPVERAVGEALALASAHGARKDAEVVALGGHFFGDDVAVVASKCSIAINLGVDDRKVDRVLPRLASALYLLDAAQRRSLEAKILRAVPAEGRAVYLDFVAYDETPLPVQMRRELWAATDSLCGTRPSSGSGDAMSHAEQQPPQDAQMLLSTSGATQKVLQHMQRGAMLLQLSGRFVIIKVSPLNRITVMDRGTAQVLRECQLRLSTATRVAMGFGRCVRGVCTDGAAANAACEREVSLARGGALSDRDDIVHIICDIHRTSLIHGKTLVLLQDNIRGMIKCSVSLRVGAALGVFRQCLCEEIDSRLRILHGRPPPEARAYREAVLDLFLSHGQNVLARRLMLCLGPNGDWRAHEVQYFVSPEPGAISDRQQVLQRLTKSIIMAMCATKPSIYPQHRWTGCDIATDELSLIEGCHALLSTSYKRFVVRLQPSLRSIFPSSAPAVVSARLGLSALEDVADTNDSAGAGGDDERAVAHAPEPQAAAGLGQDDAAWARVNASRRREAAMWLASSPFGHLVLQRILLEPLRVLLTAQFCEAGAEWQQEQQCRAAAAAMAGDDSIACRQYRLGIAGSGQHEDKFRSQLKAMWAGGGLWRLVPERCFNVSFRSLAFRACSRLGCAHRQLMCVPHERFPTRMFALLQQPELANVFATTKSCLLDPWSRGLLHRHPTLSGSSFESELLLCADTQLKDISCVEARHASVRRLLMAASNQTHQQGFHELAALWAFGQARTGSSLSGGRQQRRQRLKALRAGVRAKRSARQATLGVGMRSPAWGSHKGHQGCATMSERHSVSHTPPPELRLVRKSARVAFGRQPPDRGPLADNSHSFVSRPLLHPSIIVTPEVMPQTVPPR